MSGLAAAVRFDAGRRLPLETLEVLLRAAPHRAPDGTAVWHDPRAALGLSRHLLFDGAPAAPVARDGCALVFDGRLDNRDDLLARLPSRHAAAAAQDDAHLACAAFLEWGADAVARLDGAFAFVFWNAAESRIVAGRDRFGFRPLYWTQHENTHLFASDVAQLIAVRGVPPPDESTVADLLAGRPAADERTLYRQIQRVPPACNVAFEAGGRRLQRYWSPEPVPVAAARSDDDWAQECRALFDRAVAANMRSRGRTAVFFSGGVDSSVVLTVAAGVARRAGAQPPVAVSLVFDEPSSDERSYREAVARDLGIDVVLAYPTSLDGAAFRGQAARRLVLPDLPADASALSLYTAARSAGASVALTGVGGDSLFAGSVYHYADLLGAGRFVAAARRYWLDRSTEYSGWSPASLLTAGVWPLLSAGQRTRLRRPARRLAGVDRPWLRLRATDQGVVPAPPPGTLHSTWEIALSLQDGWTALFIEGSERASAEAAFDDRHPFLDAGIVKFVLGLPEDQRRRDRLTKVILRRAVPEMARAVAARTSKADFGHTMVAALRLLGGREFFRGLAIGDAGWVDARALAERYDRTTRTSPDDSQTGRDLPILWMVAATELWFRAAYSEKQGAMAV
jgi:asparagine synthase (glutamine-hydrolysing)